jgi:hypothetical protein
MEGDRSAGKSAQKKPTAPGSLQTPEIDNSDHEDNSLPEGLEEISHEQMPSANTAANEKGIPEKRVSGMKVTIPPVQRTFPLQQHSSLDDDLPIELEVLSDDDIALAEIARIKNSQNMAKSAQSKPTKSKTAARTPPRQQATKKEGASGGKCAIRTMPLLVISPRLLSKEINRASMAVLEFSLQMQKRIAKTLEDKNMLEQMHLDQLSQKPCQIPLHLREQMSGGAVENMLDIEEPVLAGFARGYVSHYTEEVSPVAAHAQIEASMPGGSRDATAFQMSQGSADQDMPQNEEERHTDQEDMTYEMQMPDSPRRD